MGEWGKGGWGEGWWGEGWGNVKRREIKQELENLNLSSSLTY